MNEPDGIPLRHGTVEDSMTQFRTAKFSLGQIVRHHENSFRGVVVDVDARYAGPAHEPGPDQRDQPFYRVLAMGEDTGFLVYAAEAVLEPEVGIAPMTADDRALWFTIDAAGHHAPRTQPIH
jgi:heat shock protein HspQ